MTANQLLIVIQKAIDDGNGDAVMVHSDGRSGIGEECHTWGFIETQYELASGDVIEKALIFHEGE